MNNKQLAEMIKNLRKIKMEQKLIGSGGSYQGAGADIQDPASPNRKPGTATKEIHHGVVKEDELNEFQSRAKATHSYVALKVPSRRMSHRGPVSRPLGARQQSRYRLSEKKETSNTKTNMINTTPEQDSAMIGTQ
jgi:hypothetical protein